MDEYSFRAFNYAFPLAGPTSQLGHFTRMIFGREVQWELAEHGINLGDPYKGRLVVPKGLTLARGVTYCLGLDARRRWRTMLRPLGRALKAPQELSEAVLATIGEVAL